MTEAQSETVVAGSKRDRSILLAGLITYGVGQSLLYIIFLPLGLELGMPAWQIGTIISISNLAILFPRQSKIFFFSFSVSFLSGN